MFKISTRAFLGVMGAIVMVMGCVLDRKEDVEIMSSAFKIHRDSLKSQTLEGKTIKYIDQGKGPAFVLVHGIPTSSWMYRKLVEKLSQKYRVIAPDLIGFGQSDKVSPSLGVNEQSQVLYQLLVQKLGIQSFKLMVHDFGGVVAWNMLSHEDVQIKEMVILNTFLFPKGWNNGYNFFTNLANKLLPRMMPHTFFKKGIRSMFQESVNSEIVNAYVFPLAERKGSYAYSGLYNSIPQVKREILPRVQNLVKKRLSGIPISMIWGKHDVFLDYQVQGDQIAQHLNIPKDRIFILEKGKHLIADENAEDILEFLGE